MSGNEDVEMAGVPFVLLDLNFDIINFLQYFQVLLPKYALEQLH